MSGDAHERPSITCAPALTRGPAELLAHPLTALLWPMLMEPFGPLGKDAVSSQRVRELTAHLQQLQSRYVQHVARANAVANAAVHALTAQGAGATHTAGELYDAWIERAEISYAQMAHSDDFCELVGQICNVVSGLRNEYKALSSKTRSR